MAGYSGTPLPKKLGIRAGARLLLVSAPVDFADVLGELPPGVTAAASNDTATVADVAVFFTREATELRATFASIAAQMAADGGLWIAWPKRASGVPTDLDENGVRAIGLAAGLVDNKVCAIDETWSGLRFVYRLKDRPGRRR